MASLYQQHVDKWSHCKRCDLCKDRTTVVLARGNVPAEILFIGEAPGPAEDVLGQPFVGPAGHLLDGIIKESVPAHRKIAYTNLVACIPIDDGGEKFKQPPKHAIKACEPRLLEFIRLCEPRLRLVVLVGQLAEQYAPTSDQWATISIVHPAAILRADISARPLAIKRCIVTISDAVSALN